LSLDRNPIRFSSLSIDRFRQGTQAAMMLGEYQIFSTALKGDSVEGEVMATKRLSSQVAHNTKNTTSLAF